MVKSNTLALVAAAFSDWRNSRTSGNGRIPTPLREQAVALLEQYSKAQVISALGINHSALKRWQNTNPQLDTGFVALPNIPITAEDAKIFSTLNITLNHPSGTEMCISGDITPAQLHSLANAFIHFQKDKL